MKTVIKPSEEEIFDLSREKFGIVAGMIKDMVRHPYLAKSYFELGDLMQSSEVLGHVEKQAVFLSISGYNKCKSCIKSHARILGKQYGLQEHEIEKIKNGESMSDKNLDKILNATRLMLNNQRLAFKNTTEWAPGKRNQY